MSKGPKVKNAKLVPEKELKKLAAKIKKLREEQGYKSYEDFAFTNDFSRSQFWRYEKGEDIRFSTLVKIISAFGLTVEEFFNYEIK